MVRGGARVRSGPAPDPLAMRRERLGAENWVLLPQAGRAGDPPPWPLVDPQERELALWTLLWAKPQAAAWEHLRLDLEVALYARRFVEAEKPDSPTGVGTLLRQMADSLGLTTPGMRANRWQIEDQESKPAQVAALPQRAPARDRIRVVAAEAADPDPA